MSGRQAGRGMAQRSARLYALLQVAYPAPFRREYGAEMQRVFGEWLRDAYARGGALAVARLWPLALVDLARTALAERSSAEYRRQIKEATMSRGFLARAGGVALLVASVTQLLALVAQVAILLDFAVSYTDRSGHSQVETAWIGWAEALA